VTTDPIADMLTRLRNANGAHQATVSVPCSKLKVEIAKVLKKEGFIKAFKIIKDQKQGALRLYLRYGDGDEPILTGMQRVSRPGCRSYAGYRDLPRVMNGLGIAVVSTPRGVMTDREARKQLVGGEILCYVW